MKPKPPHNLQDWRRLSAPHLRRLVRQARAVPALRARGASTAGAWQVDVAWVGEARMRALNSRHRGKRRATDVLSFPAPEPFFSQGHLGELVVCAPVTLRQARELGHDPRAEMLVLMIHGLLHLLGFDHERSTAEAKKMAAFERKLLRACLPPAWGRAPGLIDRGASAKPRA